MGLSNEHTGQLFYMLTVVNIEDSKPNYDFSYNGHYLHTEMEKELDNLFKKVENEIRHNLLNLHDVSAKEYYLKTLFARCQEAIKKANYIKDWFTIEDNDLDASFLISRPDTFELNFNYSEATFDFDRKEDLNWYLNHLVYQCKEFACFQTETAHNLELFIYDQDVNKCLEKMVLEDNDRNIHNNQFKLSKKRGSRTDLIKILYALHKLNLVQYSSNDAYPTAIEFMIVCGNFFGIDLKNYSADMGQFKHAGDETLLNVFKKMETEILDYSRDIKTND